jgi:hypothetical protein
MAVMVDRGVGVAAGSAPSARSGPSAVRPLGWFEDFDRR